MDRKTYEQIILDRSVQQFKEALRASRNIDSFGTVVPKGETMYTVNRIVAQNGRRFGMGDGYRTA
jgi:hypothetical protein